MSMTRSRHQGFTLIELIIFIVVVSVGLVGILKVMDVTVKSSADPMVRKQAMALADSILEEILLKSYNDPDGTNVGETGRVDWDNVADFNGKTNADFAPLPPELASYLIGITVVDDAVTLGIAAKRVTVTVSRGAEVISMTGYRTNY
jgi:MSHA pilin protein MshD